MIQRPQTLLLLAIVILMGLTAFSPIWSFESESNSVLLDAQKITISNETSSTIYLSILLLVSAALALFNIFQFKNRRLQLVLCSINNISITSFLLVVSFISVPNASELAGIKEGGVFNWTFYLPVAAIAANFIASKLIKKDEELVRSMDRMR